MNDRMDNLQAVFDRTDWAWLKMQARGLHFRPSYKELANWLDAIMAAAKMDGYQIEKREPTRARIDRESDR